MPDTKYAVVDRPGWFGSNVARIYSTHRTFAAAVKAMRRNPYIDEHGKRRYRCCVVEVRRTLRKGCVLYGDCFPKILA